MPGCNTIFAVSKNPTIRQTVVTDPYSRRQERYENMEATRRLAFEEEAMSRDFKAEGWENEGGVSKAQVSAIFDFSTADGTNEFLALVDSGLAYTDNILNDLTPKHSALVVKIQHASTYLAVIHTHGETIEKKKPYTEASLDRMAAYYKEINVKGPILKEMQNREAVYGDVIKELGEMKGKLETVERVAGSLLAKQEAGVLGVGGVYLTIAMRCIHSEWASIHGLRVGSAEKLREEEKVRIEDFVASMA